MSKHQYPRMFERVIKANGRNCEWDRAVVNKPGGFVVWLSTISDKRNPSEWTDEESISRSVAEGRWRETFDHLKKPEPRYPRRWVPTEKMGIDCFEYAEVLCPGGKLYLKLFGKPLDNGYYANERQAESNEENGFYREVFGHHKLGDDRPQNEVAEKFLSAMTGAMCRSRA